jgi:hypothetical protein
MRKVAFENGSKVRNPTRSQDASAQRKNHKKKDAAG